MSQVRRMPISQVLNYVPHRPPMVWVDEIITFTENSGECIVIIKEDAHFFSKEGLRASSCLEFIAQSYGYCSVAYTLEKDPNSGPLKKAFLASFKDVIFVEPDRMAKVKAGDEVRLKFAGVRQIGPITMFDGQAIHDNEILCSAQLKVFCES